MNLITVLVIVWLCTILISSIIGFITCVYGLAQSEGPITKREIPDDLLFYNDRATCYVFVPVVNIVKSTVFLLKTIKYYSK